MKKNGVTNKTKYNQVANYIYLDTQVNKAISDDAPATYWFVLFHELGHVLQQRIKAIESGGYRNSVFTVWNGPK